MKKHVKHFLILVSVMLIVCAAVSAQRINFGDAEKEGRKRMLTAEERQLLIDRIQDAAPAQTDSGASLNGQKAGAGAFVFFQFGDPEVGQTSRAVNTGTLPAGTQLIGRVFGPGGQSVQFLYAYQINGEAQPGQIWYEFTNEYKQVWTEPFGVTEFQLIAYYPNGPAKIFRAQKRFASRDQTVRFLGDPRIIYVNGRVLLRFIGVDRAVGAVIRGSEDSGGIWIFPPSGFYNDASGRAIDLSDNYIRTAGPADYQLSVVNSDGTSDTISFRFGIGNVIVN